MAASRAAASAQPAAPGEPAFRSRGYAWFVVAVLCVGSTVSMIDRQVINLLVEPIKADLGISDTQVSLLQGFAFALFYAIAAVPLARLADAGNRRNLILGGVIAFSLATMSCGLAASFAWLFAARVCVGIGEATLTPAGSSMIGDYFPREHIGRAMGLFTGATFVGSGLALMFIGALLGWLGEREGIGIPGLGGLADWRLAFLLAALPGLIFALLLLAVREPPRRGAAARESVPLAELFAHVRRHPGLFVALFVGLPLLAAAQFALNAWTPTLFIRNHGWSAAEIGGAFGMLVMVMSPVGVFAGGWLADVLHARGRGDANLLVTMVAALAAAPFALAFALAGDATLALVLLGPALLFGSMPFGAGVAAIPALAPNRMRAQLLAVYLLIANLVGGGAGPWLVAVTSDHLLGGPEHLGTALAIGVTGALIIGGAIVGWGAARQRREGAQVRAS